MRTIKSETITETIKELCIKGACHLPTDVYNRLLDAISTEDSPVSKHTLEILKENADIHLKTRNLSARIQEWPAFL